MSVKNRTFFRDFFAFFHRFSRYFACIYILNWTNTFKKNKTFLHSVYLTKKTATCYCMPKSFTTFKIHQRTTCGNTLNSANFYFKKTRKTHFFDKF